MKQEYVIAHIKQMGREICMVDTNEISYQHSANLYLEIEVDTSNTSPFKDMLLNAVGKRKGSDKTISCPLVYEDDKSYILLPEALFVQEGIVYLSLGGINDEKVVITSNMVQLEVRESNPIIATITPKEAYWQIEVRNAIQYWYETQIKSDLKQKQETVDELLEESHQQQEHAKQLQQSVDSVISVVEEKLSEGEFIPEHRWEGPVLYFKNSNGTWDEGFKIPGMDAFNWKVANCIEEATYQANIENWGTIENALLAITFTTAINASKPVLLKINEEEVHPILSGQDAMLAEELENKSTILRFDGTNWLVQTSQSGTVQSSDKSVKDIVTVTKEELKQLQASGQLVDGTLYQTEEPAEDVTSITEELHLLKNNMSNPNLLINGDFQIWQRGETFTGFSGFAYTADRWTVYKNTADNVTIKKVDSGLQFESDNVALNVRQYLENKLEIGKPYTISASVDGVIYTTKIIGGTDKIDSFLRYESFTKNQKNDAIMIRFIDINAHIINWVKLEQGSIATPFVPRLCGDELLLCQRYFQIYRDFIVRMCKRSTTTHNYMYYLPVKMRTNPTVTISADTFITTTSSELMYAGPLNSYRFETTKEQIYFIKTTSLELDSMVNFGSVSIDAEIY